MGAYIVFQQQRLLKQLGSYAPNDETLYFASFWGGVLKLVLAGAAAMFAYHLTLAIFEAWRTVRGGTVR